MTTRGLYDRSRGQHGLRPPARCTAPCPADAAEPARSSRRSPRSRTPTAATDTERARIEAGPCDQGRRHGRSDERDERRRASTHDRREQHERSRSTGARPCHRRILDRTDQEERESFPRFSPRCSSADAVFGSRLRLVYRGAARLGAGGLAPSAASAPRGAPMFRQLRVPLFGLALLTWVASNAGAGQDRAAHRAAGGRRDTGHRAPAPERSAERRDCGDQAVHRRPPVGASRGQHADPIRCCSPDTCRSTRCL
jgi:hypothetical protein